MRFEIHPDDMIRIYNETERRGEEIAVLFHSHPKTDAYPSQTDINMAAKVAIWWPDVVWVIASLTDSEPILRAFKIDGPQVEEVDLVVE